VLLTAHGIQYVARSIHGSFTAYADCRGDVWVRIDPNGGISDGVEQILSISSSGLLTPSQFEHEIILAQRQCIAFRVRDQYKNYKPIDVVDDETNLHVGTVYMSTEDGANVTGATELFVHGCAYPFYNEKLSRKPLALIYNLHMDKTTVRGRDRAGLPAQWILLC